MSAQGVENTRPSSNKFGQKLILTQTSGKSFLYASNLLAMEVHNVVKSFLKIIIFQKDDISKLGK